MFAELPASWKTACSVSVLSEESDDRSRCCETYLLKTGYTDIIADFNYYRFKSLSWMILINYLMLVLNVCKQDKPILSMDVVTRESF